MSIGAGNLKLRNFYILNCHRILTKATIKLTFLDILDLSVGIIIIHNIRN